jgi:hypothetical protein
MAKDKFHSLVRQLLEKDGWTITSDPYTLSFGTRDYEVDLAAEKMLAAERGTERILVEVKSFLADSIVYEMHRVIGQYGTYRRVLKIQNIDRLLILALPKDAFETLFVDELGQMTAQEENMKFLLFDPNNKDFMLWIK